MVRRHLKSLALPLVLISIAASAALAQQAALNDGKVIAPADCGSVVIIKCDRPAPAGTTERGLRRQWPIVQELDGIVIEADAIRRRSIEEAIGSAFPIVRPRDGNYTYLTGEGSQCTCMNICPPWPLPCCNCSAQMGRYRLMPGTSPLN